MHNDDDDDNNDLNNETFNNGDNDKVPEEFYVSRGIIIITAIRILKQKQVR